MADGLHPLGPVGQLRHADGQLSHRAGQGPAEEPDVHVSGDVGQARRVALQPARAGLRQLVLQPGGLATPLALQRPGGGLHGLGVEGAAGELLAVLDELGRHAVAQRPEDDRHRGPEEQPVGPQVDRPVEAAAHRPRLGPAALDLRQDRLAVAVHVRSDLQRRRTPVTAGEGNVVRLGVDVGDLDRAPGQALQAEHQPHLLREGRGIVVVQDGLVGHERSPCRAIRRACPTVSLWKSTLHHKVTGVFRESHRMRAPGGPPDDR